MSHVETLINVVFPQNVKTVCECLLKLMTLGNVVCAVMNVVLTYKLLA